MCKREFDVMNEACVDQHDHSVECDRARGSFLQCMGGLLQGRDAHSSAWDERLYLQAREIAEAWAAMFKGLKVPPRPDCGMRSVEVRAQVFRDEQTAMLFSERINEAFVKSGVALERDETYLCSICVVKKPRYVTEALRMDPLGQLRAGGPRVNYVMEPAVMRQVMKSVERDEIRYEPAGK